MLKIIEVCKCGESSGVLFTTVENVLKYITRNGRYNYHFIEGVHYDRIDKSTSGIEAFAAGEEILVYVAVETKLDEDDSTVELCKMFNFPNEDEHYYLQWRTVDDPLSLTLGLTTEQKENLK